MIVFQGSAPSVANGRHSFLGVETKDPLQPPDSRKGYRRDASFDHTVDVAAIAMAAPDSKSSGGNRKIPVLYVLYSKQVKNS